MANGLTTPITVTGSLTPESALIKNADGSAISNPSYKDCVYDSASGKWICANDAPAGTYPAGAQQYRLKGSNPVVVAVSKNGATVASTGPTKLSTPTGTQASATGQTSLSVVADSDPNATSWKLFNSATSGGTFTQIGGTLSSPTYNHTGLSAGQTQYYQWQKIGNGSTYSDSDRSGTFSGTTQAAPGTQPYTLTPTANDFEANGGTAQVQSEDGRERHLEMARLRTVINSPSGFNLTVRVKETNVNARYLTTYINGNFYQDIALPTDVNTLSIPIPAGNGTELLLVEPAQDRDGDAGRILGGTILDLGPFPAGTSAGFTKKSYSELNIWLVDSIGSGTKADSRQRHGFAQLFITPTAQGAFIGYGSARTDAQIGTAALRAEKLALIKKLIEEAGNPTKIAIFKQVGTNTYYNNSASPSQEAAMTGAFFQLIHDYNPAIELYVISLFTRTDFTGANAGGFTFRNYVDAAKGLPAAYPSYNIKVADGEKVVLEADLDPDDDLHLTTPGHANANARLKQFRIDGTYGNGSTDPGDGGTTPVAMWRTASPPNSPSIVVANDTPKRPTVAGTVTGWNASVYGTRRVKQPASGVTGEIARLTIAALSPTNGPITVGFHPEAVSAISDTDPNTDTNDARKGFILADYLGGDGSRLSYFANVAGYDAFDINKELRLIVKADGNSGATIQAWQDGVVDANGNPTFIRERPVTGWPLYERGVMNTGDGGNNNVPTIAGVKLTGSHVESY